MPTSALNAATESVTDAIPMLMVTPEMPAIEDKPTSVIAPGIIQHSINIENPTKISPLVVRII